MKHGFGTPGRHMSDATWRRHLARKDRELAAAKVAYHAGDEYARLPSMSTAALVTMHLGDSDWLRHPCGDSSIDGGILARSAAVSTILQGRGVPFHHGRFHTDETATEKNR